MDGACEEVGLCKEVYCIFGNGREGTVHEHIIVGDWW
jgi:hypothetical protein